MDVTVESAARPGTDSDVSLHGRRLGDFVLRECIGEGAFAAVYRCEQPLLGREAVIKVLHQRLRASEVVLQRFLREARLASRLDHPYAAHVYAFGVEPDDGLAWIAMELVHGTSLARWLSERGPLPLDLLVGFFEQVAEIVQNAHDHGIVHRDLKPSNVMMIEYAGKVFPKLLDFGIAKLVDEAALGGAATTSIEFPVEAGDDTLVPPPEGGNLHLTQANATLGSPPYMSPEQWCNPLSVGPRSDLYSLAIMAYEALTGRQPFIGPTIAAIGEQHCNAEVPPVGDQFPAALDGVFQRALAKNPAERPESALAFARELRVAAFSPPASSASTIPMVSPLRRRRTSVVIAGALALVIVAVAVYGLLAANRGPTLSPASFSQTVEPTQPPKPPLGPAQAVATQAAAAPSQAAAAPAQAVAAPWQATHATVLVEIQSTPRGAEVIRLPSQVKIGSTPWKAELPSEDTTQVFLIRKIGFGDRFVEVDLRTGGSRAVRLPALSRSAPRPAIKAPDRRAGEPLTFPTGGP